MFIKLGAFVRCGVETGFELGMGLGLRLGMGAFVRVRRGNSTRFESNLEIDYIVYKTEGAG